MTKALELGLVRHMLLSSRMPPSLQILRLLQMMTNELTWLAVCWHVVLLGAAVAVIGGWRPHGRRVSWFLISLATSVAISSLAHGNPFNGISFGALALTLAVASRSRALRVESTPRWALIAGGALVVFGSFYPEFTAVPWYRSLYAAPVGVVPCPTLAVVAGITLLAGGLGSRGLVVSVAAWAAFYAVFGVVRLGVLVDAGLIVAPICLVALLLATPRRFAQGTSGRAEAGREIGVAP